jgi:hypothetical protein
MNQLEEGLWRLLHNKYLIEAYSPVIHAAGYSPENIRLLHGEDCFALATAIQGVIKTEARARFRTVTGIFEETDFVACLHSMSPDALHALRVRIDFHPQRRRSQEPVTAAR